MHSLGERNCDRRKLVTFLCSRLPAGLPGERQSREDSTEDQRLAERPERGAHSEARQHGPRVSHRQLLLAGGEL